MPRKLTFKALESIADGKRMPTFREVRMLARELIERRESQELLTEALDLTEQELVDLHETAEDLQYRERIWRSYLAPETWSMLQRLAQTWRVGRPRETAEA